MSNYDIYISHTGKAGESIANIVSQHLSAKTYSACTALSCYANGTTFQAIQGCKDFVVILSPGCLDRDGLDINFVKEISCAIKLNKRIVALTVSGFAMPAQLPGEISELRKADAFVPVTDKFDLFLISLLRSLSAQPKAASGSSNQGVYDGDKPYIFISYSHKDSRRVLPVISGLQKKGFRVWYDEGIEVGTEWPAYIESHLIKCGAVIVFLSDNCVDSVNCRNEINVAADLNKDILVAQLDENVEYKHGMRLQLSSRQKIFVNRHTSTDSFLDELEKARMLFPCREGGYAPMGASSAQQSNAYQGPQGQQPPYNNNNSRPYNNPQGQQAQSVPPYNNFNNNANYRPYNTAAGQQNQRQNVPPYNQQNTGAQNMGTQNTGSQNMGQNMGQNTASANLRPESKKKKKSAAGVVFAVVFVAILLIGAIVGLAPAIEDFFAYSGNDGGYDYNNGYDNDYNNGYDNDYNNGNNDGNALSGEVYATDAYITWYNTVDGYEDTWQFNLPYIKDGYMYIECIDVTFNMAGEWSGYDGGIGTNGIVSLYEDYSDSVLLYATYEKASWTAGESQSFLLQIPVTEIGISDPPARIYVALFADSGTETEIPIECYFDITWE